MLFSTLFAIKEEAYANNGWVLLAMPSAPLVSTSRNMQLLQQAAETSDKRVSMLRLALRIDFTALRTLYQESPAVETYDRGDRL
ncbi:hypothetical protein [Photorhabdus viridis]|uniref:hypothetical protein n=1 Tax=Photorhabdus viridis TaxID=3163327 RepID=UPI003307A045